MSNIAFLGLGAMGSRMAARLLKAGHQVTVWNRSPDASEALAKLGAQVASTPRAAATKASFVIAMVRDDDASRFVWLDPESGGSRCHGARRCCHRQLDALKGLDW